MLDLDDVLVKSVWLREHGWKTYKRNCASDFLERAAECAAASDMACRVRGCCPDCQRRALAAMMHDHMHAALLSSGRKNQRIGRAPGSDLLTIVVDESSG